MKLPKQNINSDLGERGLTIVKRIVEDELKWVFRKNHQEHDYGIDAFIDLSTELRQMTGKSVALQIKTGTSYFSEKTLLGWVYRDSIEHLNYYLNHQLPVIILLVNEQENNAYWCLCNPEKTQSAGNNWKIIVPFSQKLDIKSKEIIEGHVSPIIDYASQLKNFWDNNKMLSDFGRIIFIVDKQSIIDKKYNELIEALEILKVNEELLEAFKGKVDIGIHGYDKDPRELYEIKEVREWVNSIFEKVRGLTYFLATDKIAQFLRIVQFCKMGFKIIENEIIENGIKRRRVEIDPKYYPSFLDEIFLDLNIFTENNGIPININKEISFNLIEYITDEKLPDNLKYD